MRIAKDHGKKNKFLEQISQQQGAAQRAKQWKMKELNVCQLLLKETNAGTALPSLSLSKTVKPGKNRSAINLLNTNDSLDASLQEGSADDTAIVAF